jgi:hypothetical protein
MTAQQLALDCEPTWLDPEPDDEDDNGPWCFRPDLWGQHASEWRLATMTTINPIGGYL